MQDFKQNVIVSGFPGVGKTELKKMIISHDSDSSSFSWSSPGIRNPEFPSNYIEHIKELIGIVLVSSHVDVRNSLAENKIRYNLVYPSLDCKEEYLKRYFHRGSPEAFIQLLDKNWNDWITALQEDKNASKHIVLNSGEYLTDKIHLFSN